MEKYETAADTAKRLNLDPSQIRRYCEQDRIPGAFKIANRWLIPKGATPEPKGFGRPPTWQSGE
jgi:hypothetical protein